MNKLNDGRRLIEVQTEEASILLSRWISEPPDDVQVDAHQYLNYTYGTIIVPDDIECDNEDFLNWSPIILKKLKLRNILAVKVNTFYARNRRIGGPELRIAKIAFESHELPQEVNVAG